MARLLSILILCLSAVLVSQSVAFALHQGKHISQSMQKQSERNSAWDDESCPTCDTASAPTFVSTPVMSVSIESTIETLSFAPPVDPKTRILRTCEARGPPSLLS